MNRRERREKKKEINIYILKELVIIIKQYFPELINKFEGLTDVRNQSIEETINLERKRWKIENEGFNIQKNGTFDIGHLYSKNSTAIKIHYLLIQIAHILRQLIERGLKVVKDLKLKIKEISLLIKTKLISEFMTNLEVHTKIQLRFE